MLNLRVWGIDLKAMNALPTIVSYWPRSGLMDNRDSPGCRFPAGTANSLPQHCEREMFIYAPLHDDVHVRHIDAHPRSVGATKILVPSFINCCMNIARMLDSRSVENG